MIDQENASVVNSVSLGAGIAALAVPGAFYFQNILSDTFLSYQQGGKKVIYGTPLDDILDKTDAELSISKFVLNSYLIAGGDGNDTITGWDYSDLLQGGIGNDILTGGKGFDLLEGGAGTDTYTINPGDGFDTILDTDGLGVIKFGTVDIKGKDNVTDDKDWIKIGDNWIDQENGFNYQLIDQGNDINDLLITLGASGDSAGVRIKNWQDGQLGITLGEGTPPDDPATNNTITGDLQPEDFDENADGVQIEYDELGNVIVTEEEALDRADTLFGSTDNDLIQSLGGNDTVDGKAGDDRIEGGSGQDQIDGGLGNDVLLGEAGSDIISGHENDDRLYAETEYTIAQAYNILNSRDHAIDYFYAPRLPGEAAEGVEDIHFHLIETRSIRCSTVAHF